MAEPDTISDHLEAAFDEAEQEEQAETPEEMAAEIAAEPINEPDTTGEGEVDNAPDTGLEPQEEAPEVVAEAEKEQEPSVEIPEYLSPEAREAWKDTPDAIKAEYATREANYQRGIEKYKQDAGRAQQIDQALAPHSQIIAMNGGAGKFIPDLLNAAAALQLGTPQQKAQAAANIINQFGVPIEELDGVLVGAAPTPEATQASQLEQMLEQKLAPVQQFMGQMNQNAQQQQNQQREQINNELAAFAQKNEFYTDVRGEMADMLDMAGKRGVEMSLQDAYNRCISLRPDIQNIVNARQSQAQVQQRTAAASSISGSPGGSGRQQAPNDTRSILESAWPVEEKL